jgi:DNA-binding NtrC family response regulator
MHGGSILVVDDDALFRAALVRYLEAEGFAVVAEGDPNAALERLEQRSFDLFVTDLRMPGIDGIQFVRRVRALDPDAVCIVATGFGSPERSIEALDAGAFWFIEKDYERCLPGPLIAKASSSGLHSANRQPSASSRAATAENIVSRRGAARRWRSCARSPTPGPRCSCSARAAPAVSSWRAPSTTTARARSGRSSR